MKDELERLENEIKENYEANMAAISELKSRMPLVIKAQEKLAVLITANNPAKSTSERIEELMRQTQDAFDIPTISLRYYQLTGRRSHNIRRIISQVINMLRQRNPPEIEVIEPGKGCRSGTYRIIKPN